MITLDPVTKSAKHLSQHVRNWYVSHVREVILYECMQLSIDQLAIYYFV